MEKERVRLKIKLKISFFQNSELKLSILLQNFTFKLLNLNTLKPFYPTDRITKPESHGLALIQPDL